jgi:hypothetical protein
LGAGLLRIAQHVAKRAGQHHDAANQEDELFRDFAGETDLVMTTIMVMQSLASCLVTSSTPHPFRSGSSAEVGSSNTINFGSIADPRAIATRCCWPPER